MKGRKTENLHEVSPFIGEQGLARLVSRARNEYRKEVLTGCKSYHRFCSDLLASVVYHDAKDAWSKNEHNRNLRIVTELLLKRRPLVDHYFSKTEFSEADFHLMMADFNKEETASEESTNTAKPANPPKADPKHYHTRMGEDTISFIVQCANEAELFMEQLTTAHFTQFYAGQPLPPLTSANNENLVLFFKTLENEGLIRHNWQHIIDKHKLVKSSSRHSFLTKAVMASTLSRVSNRPANTNDRRLLEFLNKKIKEYKTNRVI